MVKSAFKCCYIQNEVNVPRNRKAVNPLFFDGQFKGGCTLHSMTVLCGLNPSTAKAVHGVIGGKRSPASYEAGEFSFYKGFLKSAPRPLCFFVIIGTFL